MVPQENSTNPAALIGELKQHFQGERCTAVEQMFQIMSNPVRFHILCALRIRAFSVSDLVEISESNLSNTSQQLKMLWMGGYLNKEKVGKKVLYSLKDERIGELIGFLEKLYPESDFH